MKYIDEHGAYGATLASYFRVEAGTYLAIDWPERTTFAITRVRSEIGLSDFTEAVPKGEAILMSVAIRPVAAKDFQHRFNGKAVKTPSVPAFATSVLDARANPRCWVGSGFDYLHFHIPRAGLADIARDHRIAPVDTFRFVLGERDLTMAQFAKTLLPHVNPSTSISDLALDQMSLLLGAHLLGRYSGIKGLPTPKSGGLAPWQMRRALEVLRAHLDGNIRVPQVAQECGLSESHFARAFKASFGVSTIKWVIGQRVSLAKQLLLERQLSLSEVAIQAGFADQSALTRTFLKSVGVSPGRWRRERVGQSRNVQPVGPTAETTLYYGASDAGQRNDR